MEEERRDHEAKMKKMEQEMEQVFEMKVKEKTQKLKDSETDVIYKLAFSNKKINRYFNRLVIMGTLFNMNVFVNEW